MSTRSAESRDNSPDASPEKRASKKRKVLSCYACRNRKMKCDRLYPVCSRCQKTGRADQCTYDPRLLEDLPVNGDGHVNAINFPQFDGSSNSTGSSDALNWKMRMQERRLELLEKKLAKLEGTEISILEKSSSHLDSDQFADEPQSREEMMFRGKAFKTQFCGSTSPLSALTQFSELQAFTRESVMAAGNLGHVRDDFKAFRTRRKELMKEKNLTRRGYNEEIFALLPQKRILDSKVVHYFQVCETSYRILHEPSFWKEYHDFWERQSNTESHAPFAAILLYISAITKCLEPNDENFFTGDSSIDRDTALNYVETCDTWLQRLSRKQTTLAFFQLHCLSVLAKRVNCLKLKQDWISTGDVIRLAIASGLHRNPSFISKGRISEFDKEMRRRLWVTIVELEVQCSIDFGLQSSAYGLYSDIQLPSNLPDDAFASDTQQIPAGRPIEHFTCTSYAHATLKSLPLRLQLLQLLNNPTTELQYSDILHYDSQINSLLAKLPRWEDSKAETASALLNLQLQQFLLMLHRPYAKLSVKNQRFSYSFTACIDAGSAILATHEKLLSKGMLFLNHLRNDVLRAGLAIAQATFHNCTHSSPIGESPVSTHPTTNIHPMDVPAASQQQVLQPASDLKIPQLPTDNILRATLCTTAINLLEKTRQVFEHKVMRLGTGYMEYWLICSAQGLMPPNNNISATSMASIAITTDTVRSRGRKAIERVTSLCFRVLALQKDPADNLVSSLRNSVTVPSPMTPISSANLSTGASILPTNTDNGDMPILIPGAGGVAGALAEGKGLGDGTFDTSQDMQIDLTGWTFPDFWSYDLDTGGGF